MIGMIVNPWTGTPGSGVIMFTASHNGSEQYRRDIVARACRTLAEYLKATEEEVYQSFSALEVPSLVEGLAIQSRDAVHA